MILLTSYLSERVWGGNSLKKLKGISEKKFPAPLGETWEVSTHRDGQSSAGDKTLKEMIGNELNYLVKFISCEDNLSVQVHPPDEYAKLHENSKGKAECWIILESNNGGVYLGFKKGITKKIFEDALADDKADISKLLNFYPVKKGNFFFLPPGTVHALGKGIVLAEVQQASGITYRAWDWNRLGLNGKPRELHAKKSLDVLNFEEEKNELEYFKFIENVFAEDLEKEIVSHPDFNLKLFNCKKGEVVKLDFQGKNRASVIVLDGNFDFQNTKMHSYCSFFFDQEAEAIITCEHSGSFFVVE